MDTLEISRKLSVQIWSQLSEFPDEHRFGIIDLENQSIGHLSGNHTDGQWHCEDADVVFQTFFKTPSTPPANLNAKVALAFYLDEPGVFQMLAYKKDNQNNWTTISTTLVE